MRVTKGHLEAQVDIINRLFGYDDPKWDTVGAVRLSCAYGGYGVYRVLNASGGIADLMGGHLTAREASQFLSGMVAALRQVALQDIYTYITH